MRFLLRLLLGSRLPQVNGAAVAAVHAEVAIRRDRNGVPYIEAQNDHDAFFGLGYVQGQDRGFQLELFIRVVHGTLSESVGKEMIDVDRLSRRIGFHRIGRAQFGLLDGPTRSNFEAFAEGVTAGMAAGQKPHELALVGGSPSLFEAADVLGVLQFMAFTLMSNWDAELARLQILQSDGPAALAALETAEPSLLTGELQSRLEDDVGLLAAAQRFAADASLTTRTAGVGAASNNWVLSPSRTATGRPLLACDPHLSPSMPAPEIIPAI